jgi:hypothetical protein
VVQSKARQTDQLAIVTTITTPEVLLQAGPVNPALLPEVTHHHPSAVEIQVVVLAEAAAEAPVVPVPEVVAEAAVAPGKQV